MESQGTCPDGIINGMTVENTGTANPSKLTFKVFKDDGDGNFELDQDTQVGTDQSFSGNQASLSKLSASVPEDSAEVWFLTLSVSASATNSVGLSLVSVDVGQNKRAGNDLPFPTRVVLLGVAPTVSASSVSSITHDSASGGGDITDTGGANVTARGVCWDLYSNLDPPDITDINDSKNQEPGDFGTGTFTISISNLSPQTRYKARAYATNSAGTGYGSVVDFWTLSNEPTAHAASFNASTVSTSQIRLNFSAASTITNADGYIILQKADSAPTGMPDDAKGYSVGNTIGDSTVAMLIKSNTLTSIPITGLNAGSRYYYTLIPYGYDGSNPETYNYYTGGSIPGANASTSTITTDTVSGGGDESDTTPPLFTFVRKDVRMVLTFAGEGQVDITVKKDGVDFRPKETLKFNGGNFQGKISLGTLQPGEYTLVEEYRGAVAIEGLIKKSYILNERPDGTPLSYTSPLLTVKAGDNKSYDLFIDTTAKALKVTLTGALETRDESGKNPAAYLIPGTLPASFKVPVYPKETIPPSTKYKYSVFAEVTLTKDTRIQEKDDVPPVPDIANLPDATGECEVIITNKPTAMDAIVGPVTGTTNDPLEYTEQGTHTVTWTYDDGNGNTTSQEQKVIVKDTTAPVPQIKQLPEVSVAVGKKLTAPKATDNCAGEVTGTTKDTYTEPGKYTVTWTYDDGNDNQATQKQVVIVNPIAPSAPKNLTATETTSTSITITWQAPESEIAEYQVSYGVPDTDMTTSPTQKTTFTATELKPNTSYNFQVAAKNSAGFSEAATLSVTTLVPAPKIVSLVAADPDNLDKIFSAGDTITITFDVETNQPTVGTTADIDALFNFSPSLGANYHGEWQENGRKLVITVSDSTGHGNPEIGSFTVTIKASGNLKNAAGTSEASTGTSPMLEGNWGESAQVAAVKVNGTTWKTGPYDIPTGATQLDTIPFANINQVIIVFTSDVIVKRGDLTLNGVSVPTYDSSSLNYDQTNFTATWDLASPIDIDKLTIILSDTVTSKSGVALDGEWTDSDSTFVSGDGAPGGDFNFRFNVLPGDANQDGTVNIVDLASAMKQVQEQLYDSMVDINRDGVLSATDAIFASASINKTLPSGVPTVTVKPSLLVSPTSITVPEEGSETFTVKLDRSPGANVTVTVANAGGAQNDPDLQPDPQSLTFTPTDAFWNTGKTVTVTAADDVDILNSSATIQVISDSVLKSPVNVTATEEDDDKRSISGAVTEKEKPVNVKVGVLASSASTGSKEIVETGANGNYRIENLKPANDYIVIFTWKAGSVFRTGVFDGVFNKDKAKPVDVTKGDAPNINFAIPSRSISGTIAGLDNGEAATTCASSLTEKLFVKAPVTGSGTGQDNYEISQLPPASDYEVWILVENRNVPTQKTSADLSKADVTGINFTVPLETFKVDSLTPTDSGFEVQFNRAPVLPSDVSKVSLVGEKVKKVEGTLSLKQPPNTNTVIFTSTAGALAADTYTVTLFSSQDGWKDKEGKLLDGNKDETAGDDYTKTFAVTNSIPVAVDDSGSTDEDTKLTIKAPSLLDNDTDLDGDSLSVVKFDKTSAEGAKVTVNPDGSYTYDPEDSTALNALKQGASTTDTFEYKVDDSKGGTDTAEVTITVSGVNDAPVGKKDEKTLTADKWRTLSLNLLDNDTDPEGKDTLSVTSFALTGDIAPSDQGVLIESDGLITFTEDATFLKRKLPELFDGMYEGLSQGITAKYTLSDDVAEHKDIPVKITITGVNDPPVANSDTAVTNANKTVTVNALINDTDPDFFETPELKTFDTTSTKKATVSLKGEVFTYDPTASAELKALEAGKTADDTFTYTITDKHGATDTGTVTVTVTGVGAPPEAVDDTATVVSEDGPAVPIGVMANDSPSDTISIDSVTQGKNGGAVAINGANVTYNPNRKFENLDEGATGTDTFTYTISNSNGVTDTATVTVTIQGKNDAPVAARITAEIGKDADTIDVLASATDVDDRDLTLDSVKSSGPGTAEVQNNELRFVPDLSNSKSKTVVIEYTISDDSGAPSSSFVVITLLGVSSGSSPASGFINVSIGSKSQAMRLLVRPPKTVSSTLIRTRAPEPKPTPLPPPGTRTRFIREVYSNPQADEKMLRVDPEDYGAYWDIQIDEQLDGVLEIDLSVYETFWDESDYEVEFAPPNSDFDPISGLFSWKPGPHDGDGPEGYRIWPILFRIKEVGADESEAWFVEGIFRIRVDNVNLLPELAAIENVEIAEGMSLSIPLNASDFDGDAITFETDGLPDGAELIVIGDDSAGIEWTPPFTTIAPTEEAPELLKEFAITARALDAGKEIVEGQNTRSFTVTVTDTNQAPVLVGELSAPTVSEGESLEFPVQFTDPDGDPISLAIEGVPEAALFTDNGDGTGALSWQTDFSSFKPEGYGITLVAKDDAGGETHTPALILVENVNQPPAFDDGFNEITLVENETREITIPATDPDNEPLEFTLLEGELPLGTMQIAGDKLIIATGNGDSFREPYALKLKASDASGGSAEASVALTVYEINVPPSIESIPLIHNGVEGEELQIQIIATDDNNDQLSFSVSGDAPAGDSSNIDAETGLFSWTPEVGGVGAYNLTFTVTEESFVTGSSAEIPRSLIIGSTGLSTEVKTELVIMSKDGPVIRNLDVLGNGGIVEIKFDLELPPSFAPVAATVRVNDVDLQTLENLATGTQTISWDTTQPPVTDDVTEYRVSVAIDDIAVAIDGVLIDNSPPVVSGGNLIVNAGELATLLVQATDNDRIESLEVVFPEDIFAEGSRIPAQPLAGGDVGFYQAQLVIPTDIGMQLQALEIDALTYTIEAFDRAGNEAVSGPFTLTVTDEIPPTAQITLENPVFKQGEDVTLDGFLSEDNSGGILSYAWDLDASDGVVFDPADETEEMAIFTAQESVEVNLRVTDQSGNSATATAFVEVIDLTPPEPPVLITNLLISAGMDAALSGFAEPAATIEISSSVADILLTTTANGDGIFEATATDLLEGSYRFTAVARDAAGNISAPSEPFILAVDGTPPEIEIDIPDDLIANDMPAIPVTVSDMSGVAVVTLRLVEHGASEVALNGGSQRDAAGEDRVTVEVVPVRYLIDGLAYSLEVTASDLAGNSTTSKLPFVVNRALIDEAAPQITFVSPSADGFTDGNPPASILLADNGSGLDFSSFEASLEGQDGAIEGFGKFTIDARYLNQATASLQLTGLKPGEHRFSGTIKDKDGNIGEGEITFTVLEKPPVIALFSAIPEIVDTQSVSIFGTVDLAAVPGGAVVEISVNDNLVKSALVLEENEGQMGENLTLGEGLNRLSFVTVNAAGMRSDALTFETILDTQAPKVDSLMPKDSSSIIDAAEIQAVLRDSTVGTANVSGIYPESIEVTLTRIEKMVDGEAQTVSEPITLNRIGYDKDSGNLSVGIAEDLENLSKYTVKVTAEDNAGNSVEEMSTFTIDRGRLDDVEPVILAVYPADEEVIDGEELANLVISASISDESGLAEVTVELDGKLLPLGLDENPLPPGNATWTFEFAPSEGLTGGFHLLSIFAEDNAYPSNVQTTIVGFTVETSIETPVFDAAAISSRQTAEGVLLLDSREAMLMGTAEPEATLEFSVNGQSAGSTQVDFTGDFFKSLLLLEGESEIIATVTKGGNSADSEPLNVFVDLGHPLIGNAIPEPDFRTKEADIAMSVQISDGALGSGINPASLTFVLDGNVRIGDFNFDADSGLLTYTANLAEGEHFFRVFAEDFAGNQTIFNSGLFAMDLTAPRVAYIYPEGDETLANPTPEISVIFMDDDIQSVELQLSSVDAPETQIPGQGGFNALSRLFTFTPDNPLPAGMYQMTILATDIVGNISESEVPSAFSIDTESEDITPPNIIPRYPNLGQTIGTSSAAAIRFYVLDADSGVDFSTVFAQINGINVGITGEAVSLNSETGEATIPGEEFSLNNGVNAVTIVAADNAGNYDVFRYNFVVSLFAPRPPALNFGDTITRRPDGTRYTNSSEIAVTGEVPDADVVSASEVEIRVNGEVAGVVPVAEDGTFSLERILLEPGDNQVTAFARTTTMLQSEPSIPQVLVLDTTPPDVEFVDLPTWTPDPVLLVNILYSDNIDVTPENITLTVNDEEVALVTEENEAFTVVELIEGENKLTLSAMDAAGNVSDTIKVTVTMSESAPEPWDVNGDNGVDIGDLVLVGSHFGETAEPGDAWDVNADGMVDIADLALVGIHFGESYGGAEAAPAISENASTQVTMSAEFTDGLFTILVKAEDCKGGASVPNLNGFQFDFGFDKKLASIVRVLEGSALKSKGTSYWLTPKIEKGNATVASALFSSGVALSRQNTDATVLAKITLKLKGEPQAALESIRLSNVKLANSNGRQIPYALRNFVEFARPKQVVRNALLQNYPNPFNPETWIPYSIAADSQVTISVYNVAGQLVRKLDIGYVKSGEYMSKADAAYWNGRNDSGERVASGVYFYTIKAGKFMKTKRLVVLK